MEIYTKISKRKDIVWSRQKQGKIRTTQRGVRMVCEFRTPFAQLRGCASFAHHSHAEGVCEFRTPFARLRGCASFAQAWSSCLPKAISSSFQLQIVHGLKRWILDFLSFEMVYSMQKMGIGKCSKSAKEDCSCCPLFSSLLLFASLCFSPFVGLLWCS